jgi:sulfite reductase (NADPH) hemoprotein beta-component
MSTLDQIAPTPKLSKNEGLKVSCPTLEGTIAQSLADEATDRFSDEDYEFLKFHGVYQQDDRDLRKSGNKHYMMMVRTRFPGGVLSGSQYVVCDDLATRYGNNTLRVTTRQDFQFHGVIKRDVRNTIRSLNEALMTTIAACGDVARNVMAPPTPATSAVVDEVLTQAAALSKALSPTTRAYHSIWLEGQELSLAGEEKAPHTDPLYRQNYLPRKFKVAFAIPPINDVDVFANDLGFVAIVEGDRIAGYNLLAGGGLGMSHGNPQTYPRVADIVGFLKPEHLETFAKAVLTVHRDFGDRSNRKHARLKYVIAERGVDWFRSEIEQRTGIVLEPARPFTFSTQGDVYGWHQQKDGRWFLGLFIENGRIADRPGYQLKTGLRKAIEKYLPEVRLTPTQNLLLVNVEAADRAGIDHVLAEHGVSSANPFSRTRLASMACPSLPTCGLGLAESERALPNLLTQIETLLNELGLSDEEIVVRMTGCPNGCARPYLAEVAFVGKAPNKYQLYLGGSEKGTRLNRVYKDSVKGEEIAGELRTVLARFVESRLSGERFGDFCHRVLWASDPELAPVAG